MEDVKVRPEAVKLLEGREALKDVELGEKIRGVDVGPKSTKDRGQSRLY